MYLIDLTLIMKDMNMHNNLNMTLDNFQSISSAELTFEQGINIIVGQSNSGKSAILRAIRALLLNTNGSARFIKKNTDQATVTIDYNDNSIEWDRKKKESKYKINGELFSKTGNSNAFKILNDNTGFVLDDNSNLMNMESELELPFPFGYTPSELFKLFENVFCVSDSSTILRGFKEDEDNTQKQLNEINSNIRIINEKIQALQSLKQEVDLDKLKVYKNNLTLLNEQQTTLREDLEQLTLSQQIINKINLNNKYSNFNLVDRGTIEYKNILNDFVYAKKTGNLVKLSKTFNINIVLNDKLLDEYKSILNDYNILKNISKLVNILEFKKTINIDFDFYSCYNKLCKDYKDIKQNMQLIKSLMQKQEELKEVIVNCNKKIKEFKVCPLCGHEL